MEITGALQALDFGELNVNWLRNRFHEAPDEKLEEFPVTNEIIVTDREQYDCGCLGRAVGRITQRIFFLSQSSNAHSF